MNTYCHASLATTKKDNCEETLEQNPLLLRSLQFAPFSCHSYIPQIGRQYVSIIPNLMIQPLIIWQSHPSTPPLPRGEISKI